MGCCCRRDGDYQQAIEALDCAIELNSNHALAHYERGISQLKLHDASGLADLNRALALNPKLWQVQLTKASMFGLMGRYPKAILCCNEVYRLSPFFCFLTPSTGNQVAAKFYSCLSDTWLSQASPRP